MHGAFGKLWMISEWAENQASEQHAVGIHRKKAGGVKMAYKLMKRIIERGGYDRAETMDKLDAFLAADRITAAQYQELVAMMGNE